MEKQHLTIASSITIIMMMQLRIKSLCYFLIAFYILCIHNHISIAYPQTNIHHQMSIEDLKSVFQVDSHSSVPEYQIVHVRSLHKREAPNNKNNTKEVHITAFGQDFRLQLQRNDHLSKSAGKLKVYVAEMHTDGNLNLTEVTFPGNTSDIGEVYQDDASGAAVVLHHDEDGALLLDGTIGSNLAIKPAPASVRDEYQQQQQHPHNQMSTTVPDDEMFMDNELPFKWNPEKTQKDKEAAMGKINKHNPSSVTRSATKGIHIVYQRKPQDSSTFSDYMFMEPDRMPMESHRRHRSPRQVRETPQAVWPEILVIVDYDTYNMHGGNNMDIKRYFISFWNGVDLRYKLLGGPKVRISLAGIIISKGRDATPYLENNRVGGNAVDSAGALTELGKYLYRERRLPTYDVAVVVTKLDICRRRENGVCRRGTAGFAYVGGACVVNKRLEKVNSVAIIEDTGGFSGIIVAAHEVGHLLGAVHDGSPPPSYLGGPGAEHCRWEDGYIMSDLRHTERGFKWSICSTQQFKHFLNGETAKCLYNIPHEEDELPRLLPGKLLSLDAQCRKDRGTSACFKDDRVCAQLFCFDSRSGYCVSYRPAAEGSPCGDGLYCINGRCVPENENVIPDYSRVSEIVVPKPPDVTFNEENEEIGEVDQNADLARIITPPRRTATLDNDEDVSIVSSRVDDKTSEVSKTTPHPENEVPFKRTSVLDNEENESLQQNERNDEHLFDVKQPLNDHDATVELPPSSAEEFNSNREVIVEDNEGSLAYKRPSRLDDSHPSSQHHNMKTVNHSIEPEVPHMRRTSHLDEVDELSFSEDVTTLRNNPNSVTKTGHQVVDNLDKEVECDDVMRELAGGLTCKQFLRRFGDRYCNHHYIMANCCSSRKAICEV